jgi:hypothetical protein
MAARVLWLRTKMKEQVQIIVEHEYGFINPVESCDDRLHNKQLFKRLWPDSFHCKVRCFTDNIPLLTYCIRTWKPERTITSTLHFVEAWPRPFSGQTTPWVSDFGTDSLKGPTSQPWH